MKVSELKEKLSKEYDAVIDVLIKNKEAAIKLALSKETRDNGDCIISKAKIGQIKCEITIFSKDIVKE